MASHRCISQLKKKGDCLAKKFDANVNQENGCVPRLVEVLDANIKQAALDGSTPLMVASLNKHEKVIRYLLKKGANAQLAGFTHRRWHGGRRLSGILGVSRADHLHQCYIYIDRTYSGTPGCRGVGLTRNAPSARKCSFAQRTAK
jgi:ankyrin repeat protein